MDRRQTAGPALSTPAVADEPVTYGGVAYGARRSPTRDKPQSKLWYQDGAWWALMIAPDEQFRVFELQVDQAWRDTGVVVDERPHSTADALWDGSELHVVSRTSGGEVRFLSLTYLPEARSYQVQPGFPIVLYEDGATSVAMTEDSTGLLWATFQQGSRVFVTHSTTASGDAWVVPSTPLAKESVVTNDDISSVISFDGRVGLMWSNQRTGAFYFTSHVDGTPDTQWTPVEVPLQGEGMADGHVALAAPSEGSPQTGSLYAGVKTSLDDIAASPSTAPLVLVLERSPDGRWTQHVVGTVEDSMTRPVLLLEEDAGLLHVFTTSPMRGGRIHQRSSATEDMRWVSGLGRSFIAATGAVLNDATSTKQSVNVASGIVVLASDTAQHRYYHTTLLAERAAADG